MMDDQLIWCETSDGLASGSMVPRRLVFLPLALQLYKSPNCVQTITYQERGLGPPDKDIKPSMHSI